MYFDDFFWILLIYAAVSPLITLCLSIMAFRRTTVLRGEVAALRLRIIGLGEAAAAPEPAAPAPEEPLAAEAPLPDEGEAPPEPAEVPEPPLPAPAPAVTPPKIGWEQRLASRWLLWLGGIALALGGAFLVKVTIDVGLLTPALRCGLGVLLGLGLAAGGEVLRRKPQQKAIAALAGNHLPTALSAAGIACLFASFYAAHGLYGLIPAALAFPLLAGTAFLAVGLSLLQGPFLAALGLVGGFLTPFVVQSSAPAALPLFALLMALTLAALAVARYRAWTWLAASALAGAIGWALLWTGAFWQSGDGLVFGLYLLALAAVSVGFRYGLMAPLPGAARFSPERQNGGLAAQLKSLDPLVSLAALGILFNAFFLLRHDHYSLLSLAILGLIAAFFVLSGRRAAALIALPWLAAGTVLASLAFWHLPQIIEGAAPLLVLDGVAIASPRQPIVPPVLLTFTVVSALYALLFAALGYAFLWGARRPGAWAGFSAGLPLTILVIAYWRIAHFEVSLSWAALALVLGGLALWAAERSRRAGPALKGALGAYAVAVVAAVALAATMELREAWLTVALSLMLPAIAWIDSRLELAALRATAFAVAAAVIFRLVLNQTLMGGSPLGHPLFNWLLYGYGLPALAFAAASLIFRRRADDGLVALLESGALFFLTLLISFEIRSLFNAGDIGARSYALAEQATLVLAWLGLATSLLYVNRRHQRPVLAIGWKVLGAWGLMHLALGPLSFANPLVSGAAVGPWPVFNLMGLAYLLPAALLALFAWLAARQGETWAARIAAIAILGLVFMDLSLEVRHGFHGQRLDLGRTTTAEWYAYSLAWLAYAGSLLGGGLRFGQKALRHAGLALLSLVVLKVFLFDMATLTGLYRALSFLGLGASLVAIGYLYQRLFFPPQTGASLGEDGKILGKS